MNTPLDGPEALKRLEARIKERGASTECPIHPLNAYDLLKLEYKDLKERKFDRAEEINVDLCQGKIESLGRALGVRLVRDPDAPLL